MCQRSRKLFVVFIVMIALLSYAVHVRAGEESCDSLETEDAKELCFRVKKSSEMLRGVTVNFVSDKKGNALEREVVLALCPKGEEIVLLRIRTAFLPKAGEKIVPVIAGAPRYRLEHVRGQFVHKLTFSAYERMDNGAEREVPVCAGKHLFVPYQYRGQTKVSELGKTALQKVYHPVTPQLYHEEFFLRGLEVKRRQMSEVFTYLASVGAPSRAFPGSLLSERYTPEQLTRVFAIEQTDPFRRYGMPFFGKPQEPEPILMKYVFAELFLWGDEAFSNLCSSARACGRFQFTNNKVGRYPGTYTVTRGLCKGSDGKELLDPDFWNGTASTKNSAIAAVCLLDHELSTLPKEARDWYVEDPESAMALPIIMYNTGGSWGKKIYQELVVLGDAVQGFQLTLKTYKSLPRDLFRGMRTDKKTRKKVPFINQEPCFYVHKWFESLEHGFGGDPTHRPACGVEWK